MTTETGIPCEHEHDFVLALTGVSELSQEQEDALFEAGCDDATISIRSGRVFLSFSRGPLSKGCDPQRDRRREEGEHRCKS